jgi:hypothetical protein
MVAQVLLDGRSLNQALVRVRPSLVVPEIRTKEQNAGGVGGGGPKVQAWPVGRSVSDAAVDLSTPGQTLRLKPTRYC